MYCKYCGKEIKKDNEGKYCPYCGKIINEQETKKTDNGEGSEYSCQFPNQKTNTYGRQRLFLVVIVLIGVMIMFLFSRGFTEKKVCEECGQYVKCNKFVCDEGYTHYYCDDCIVWHKMNHYCDY